MSRYLSQLKEAVTGAADTTLVFVCNFEVERQWATGHVGLPGVAVASAPAVVQRMEELGVLLAGPADHLLLKHPLDTGYLDYLTRLGFRVPAVLCPERTHPDRSTTEDALDSPDLLRTLRGLSPGARLLPMGAAVGEQKLADSCGLSLAGAGADVAERVNGKVYGRRLTARAGLREVPGHCCETVDELAEALGTLDAVGRPLVVKDAYGVSGRGLVVVDTPARAGQLMRLVRRRAERTGDDRIEVVVEQWLPRRHDLNYQLTVTRDGGVRFDFVKQALTEAGVHKGHLMPAALTGAHRAEIEHAAQSVGAALYRDGFTGVAGVDAIIDTDGQLYPVLEINARLNMSTYQGGVVERYQPPDGIGLARHYTLRLRATCPFDAVESALDRAQRGTGGRIVVTSFGTLNAAAPSASTAEPFDGRLYAMLFAPGRPSLDALDGAVRQALGRIPQVLEVR
ncbi:ATP-binding protein [Catenuloplanes indicus]|uniref:ATP-grasp domain-containing protein n=1 Tax=Catenuloplanes indicus TaxID=137267 RepID=A0AAE3VX99_9ACTN|nr:ATP-grasp domain-containing protein [Catenuloplanes indicus]MDQ0364987.1 hypothetical protein [Catenuloplanes indicus]